jgi:hypothetical protein
MLNVLSNAECAQVACTDMRTEFGFNSGTDACAVDCLRIDNGVLEQLPHPFHFRDSRARATLTDVQGTRLMLSMASITSCGLPILLCWTPSWRSVPASSIATTHCVAYL